MSLRRLMNNKISIQSAEASKPSVYSDGAIDRQAGWVTLENFKNLRCNIQDRKKMTVTTEFQRHEEENDITCYHQSRTLWEYLPDDQKNQTTFRVLSELNPRKKLVFPGCLQSKRTVIYEFMGHIEQVAHPTKRLYILKLKKSDKWRI